MSTQFRILAASSIIALFCTGNSLTLSQERADASVPRKANARHSDRPGRLRLIVETDAGGDPDDEQSLVRFLLYSNEWDVEGIIATRPTARDGENKNTERTGLGIIHKMIRAYGDCYSHLAQH